MGPKNAPMNEWPSLVEIMGLDLDPNIVQHLTKMDST